MLKFTKALLGVLGLAALGVGIYCFVKLMWRWNTVMGYAQANHATVDNPRHWMFLTAGLALLSGLLLGLAIAMPNRTVRSIRKGTRLEVENERAMAAGNAGLTSTAPLKDRTTTTSDRTIR